MRARLALHYCSCQLEHREVLLRDKPEAMLKASPKATVPVLILIDGTVIDESLDIMHWALEESGSQEWLTGLEPEQRRLAEELVTYNDNEFKTHLDHYKYSVRFPERGMEDYRTEGEVFLSRLEQLLEENPFLVSANMSIADAAIFPFVRQFAFVDKAWFDKAPYPKLQDWLEKQLSSELFSRVMKKYPQWQPGDNPIIYP